MTDLANAIRKKKGTTEPINPQDFSAEIATIETGGGEGGGGGAAVSANDVNFRDYDGTILHSFSKADFLALSELPELPTQKGLTCQGWNYTLADAQSYVQEYGVLEVGATYITDDGKTRLYIRIAEKGRMNVPLYFSQSRANGVTIDWGDGSATQTLSGTGKEATTHTYADKGDYVITLGVADDCTLGLGHASTAQCVMGSTQNEGKVYCNMLQKAVIGKGVTKIDYYAFFNCCSLSSVVIPQGVTSISSSAFYYCYSLSSVVIPQGVTSIGSSAFYYCYSLSSAVIPQGVTSIDGSAFYNCCSLSSVVIPQGVTSINNNTFYNCYSLSSAVIPQGVTSIGSSAFYYCCSLSSVVIPQGVTSISSSAFYYCYSLSSVVIPQGVTSIGSSAFYNCYSLSSVVIPQGVTSIDSLTFYYCTSIAYFDFREHTSVPTLSNTNAFYNAPSDLKIIVPDALYDEWKEASNWSSYASKIVKASEFNG